MKYLIATLLMSVGGLAAVVGKYGTILSILGFVAGLIGMIPVVSFWYVILFVTIGILGVFSAATAAYLVHK